MQQTTKYFKWWYTEGILNYKDLLEAERAVLIAMTSEEDIIRQSVSLTKENDLVFADLGPTKGTYCFTPNQQITNHTETLKDFWLVEKRCCWESTNLLGYYNAIEAGNALILPEGVEIFGVPNNQNATVLSTFIKAIVPIGDERYIAYDENSGNCYIAGPRETDDIVIKNLMARTARS